MITGQRVTYGGSGLDSANDLARFMRRMECGLRVSAPRAAAGGPSSGSASGTPHKTGRWPCSASGLPLGTSARATGSAAGIMPTANATWSQSLKTSDQVLSWFRVGSLAAHLLSAVTRRLSQSWVDSK